MKMSHSPSPQELKDEGMRLFQQGKHKQALAAFEQAAAGFAAQEDVGNQAEMLNNMGVVLRVQRKMDTAVTTLNQAAQLFAQIGDHNRHAQTLGNLGDIYAQQKKYTEAARHSATPPPNLPKAMKKKIRPRCCAP